MCFFVQVRKKFHPGTCIKYKNVPVQLFKRVESGVEMCLKPVFEFSGTKEIPRENSPGFCIKFKRIARFRGFSGVVTIV